MFDIFDKVLSVSWLYEKVFWKLLPDLVYNQVAERQKQLLTEVYGYKDVNSIFKKELLKWDTINLIKIVFKYTEQGEIIKSPKNE
jgi:hypothetical protein